MGNLIACICSYLLPPLGVYWKFGCGTHLLINIILTCLGYVPGLIHACLIIGLQPAGEYQNMRGAPDDAVSQLA